MGLFTKFFKHEMAAINAMESPFETVRLDGCVNCTKLFSRKVWQVLFNEYRSNGGELDRMDNMLCDLYTIQWYFDEWEKDYSDEGFEFRWFFHSIWTTIEPCDRPCFDKNAVRVRLNVKDWQIEFYREKQYGE